MKLSDWKRFSLFLKQQGCDCARITFDDERVKELFHQFCILDQSKALNEMSKKRTFDLSFISDILIKKATTREEMGCAIEFERLLKEILDCLNEEDCEVFLNILISRVVTLQMGKECLDFLFHLGNIYQVDVDYLRIRIRRFS